MCYKAMKEKPISLLFTVRDIGCVFVCSFVVRVYTHFIANQGKSASAAQTLTSTEMCQESSK